MTDRLSTLYQDLLRGSCDCVDRIVLNAYFRMGHDPGGFRVWWPGPARARANAEKPQPMPEARPLHPAGSRLRQGTWHSGDRLSRRAAQTRSGRRISGQDDGHPRLVSGPVGRAQAPVWDVNAKHHIERKKPMPYVNHYSFHILDPDWGHLTIKIS